jgi:hypothetical protein
LRKNKLISLGVGVVGIAIAVAAMLAFAAGGRAASPNVCTTSANLSANPPVYSSCVKEAVFPHTLGAGLDFAAGQSAVSITRFLNQASGTTATHTDLIATFSRSVQVDSIVVFNNGLQVSSPTCSPALSSLPANAVANGDGTFSVTCSNIGNTSGGNTARMLVRFSVATTGSLSVFGSATYGESGSDNPGGPNGTLNDRQRSAPQAVNVIDGAATFAQSKCTTTNFAVNGGDSTISASLIYASAADQAVANICTPASTGIIPGSLSVHTQIAFADVGALSGGSTPLGGLATFKLFVTPLWSGVTLKTAQILEDVSANQDFSSYIVVPACMSSGAPPNPGVPAAPAAGPNPQVNDSCIYNRSPLPKGGGEFDMHIFGSSIDPRYGG